MKTTAGHLGVTRGTALYVGALMGPGVLLVPSLAVQAAGPASVVAWLALLVLSAPLAITFAALGVRHPVAGGVSVYVRQGLGEHAAAVTGVCFLTAVVVGAPAVSLIGGYYVADLTGTGTPVAVGVALGMYGATLVANAFGLRVASGVQLGLCAVLVTVVTVGVAAALPAHATDHWTPDRDLPRAIALAFAVVTALYLGLAVASVTVSPDATSRVPLADLLAAGFGNAGRSATVGLAVVLTTGTMNVYVGGAAKLAAALAQERALPAWLGAGAEAPRRPLAVLAVTGPLLLVPLAAGALEADVLVRATSACFIAVYLLTLLSAVRILAGTGRRFAGVALALTCVLAVFSGPFLLVPAAAAAVATGVRRRSAGHPAFDTAGP